MSLNPINYYNPIITLANQNPASARVQEYKGQKFFGSGNAFVLQPMEAMKASFSLLFISTRLPQMAVPWSVRLLKFCVSSLLVL
jgi:hypothetical protein